MFGVFRYILAVLVLVSHVYTPVVFNYGVSAVICFFMISGYVMTQLIHANYSRLGKPTLYFYLDRFLRIFPQYFLFMMATQMALWIWPFQYAFFKGPGSIDLFLMNLLIFPTNYFLLYPPLASYLLIPAAWSLGLEEQFYWVFPFLVLKKWLGRILTVASFSFYVAAVLGYFDTENFAFRLLPGMIFVFMLGKNLAEYRVTKSQENLGWLGAIYSACVVLTLCLWSQDYFWSSHTKEVQAGILLGFPILAGLSSLPRRSWDEWIGKSSYGIFLCHVLVLNFFIHFGIFLKSYEEAAGMLILFSTVLGFAGFYLVEAFVTPLRYRIRNKVRRI